MAEFKNIVITKQGQALMAKALSGIGSINFTRLDISDKAYNDDQLEELVSLADVKQSVVISKTTRINEIAVKLEAAVTNEAIEVGYHMQTMGLFAKDTAEEDTEILYGVMSAKMAAWMPPYNGVGASSAIFDLYVTVGNADQVSLDVTPGTYATVTMLDEIREIADGKIDKKANRMLTSLGDSTIFNLETGFYPVAKDVITEAMANAGDAPAINPDSDSESGYCNVLGAYLTVVRYDKDTVYCTLKVINDLQGEDGIQLQMKEFTNMFIGPNPNRGLWTGWIENSDEQLSYGSTSPARNSRVRYALDTKVNVADVESTLSASSTNPIQSKAVYEAIQGLSGGSSNYGNLFKCIWTGHTRDYISIKIDSSYLYSASNNLKVLTLGLNVHGAPANVFYEECKLIFVNIYLDLDGYGGIKYSTQQQGASFTRETFYGSQAPNVVSVTADILCFYNYSNYGGISSLSIYCNYSNTNKYCGLTDVFVLLPTSTLTPAS